jgi:hypothetical protein
MTDHEIKKPTLFISHAESDAEFANAVKQEIEKVFVNGVNVFCASNFGGSPSPNPIGPTGTGGTPGGSQGIRGKQCQVMIDQ